MRLDMNDRVMGRINLSFREVAPLLMSLEVRNDGRNGRNPLRHSTWPMRFRATALAKMPLPQGGCWPRTSRLLRNKLLGKQLGGGKWQGERGRNSCDLSLPPEDPV